MWRSAPTRPPCLTLQFDLQVRAHQHISAKVWREGGGGELRQEIDVSLATIWLWPRFHHCCSCCCVCCSCLAFGCFGILLVLLPLNDFPFAHCCYCSLLFLLFLLPLAKFSFIKKGECLWASHSEREKQ